MRKLIGSFPYGGDVYVKVVTNLIQMKCCMNVCTSAVLMVVNIRMTCMAFLCLGVMPMAGWADMHVTMRVGVCGGAVGAYVLVTLRLHPVPPLTTTGCTLRAACIQRGTAGACVLPMAPTTTAGW